MATAESCTSSAMKECYENYILIDTGTNLTNKKFGRDLESVIKRATDAGEFFKTNVPYKTIDSSKYSYTFCDELTV